MFVNKINILSNNIRFKGYQHVQNDVGESVMRFNFPYNSDKEDCEIQIFRAIPNDKYNYNISETPIASVQLQPEGVDVNLDNLTNLDRDDAFAYKVVRRDKATGKIIWEGADTGVKVKNDNGEYVFRVSDSQYVKQVKDKDGNVVDTYTDFGDSVENYKFTLVTRKGTRPMVQGAGYLITPDSYFPGAQYRGFKDENTGEIFYNKELQEQMEGIAKNFSNTFGGSLAGLQAKIPELKAAGYKTIFTTPIANGSKAWSLGYWSKNNMQVSPSMGNTENFASLMTDLYKNGLKYVNDGTFVSESIEGNRFQYALRWADKNPQFYYMFKMSGLKDSNLGFGVVPNNKENLRHRLVNAPYNYELQQNGIYKKIANPNYNPNKETLFQIYDGSQVSDNRIKDLDNVIDNYDKLKDGKTMDIINHDDTLINYVFQIDPKEYQNRINIINELNKKFGKNINLDTADGTIMVSQFSNFKIDKRTEGGFVTWDSNSDMAKLNYHISGYDEKILQAIPDRTQRDYEKKMIERGAKEAQDMAIQSGKYWTAKVNDIQNLYTAKTIAKAKTVEDINKLIADNKLPAEARINNKILNNILNGQYLLAPKGTLDKDDVTVKALMKMPLDALELGDNTVGVLTTSYFSNRATSDETIGVSRFDLMKQNNPHLVEPYAKVYNKVNGLFNNEIKDFAHSIVKNVNEKSNEKLIDVNGDYTEYGEYVINLVGQDITKYAILKALASDKLKTKTLNNGEITYDYDSLKESTTLKALGINAHSPQEEALVLEHKLEKGLKNLSRDDVNYVSKSILSRIENTDTISFRLAEAIVDRSALGLDWRLDAAKDVMDMDSVRNEDDSFDDNWNDVIQFWAKFVSAIKDENPNSYVVAEVTDVPLLMQDTYGKESCPYEGKTNIGQKFNGDLDANSKLFNETGISSEAGYPYFFTNLLTSFSPAFDTGNEISQTHDDYNRRFDLLLQTRSADYIRNLYTFMGNHDKPRMLHGLAVDMELFQANLLNDYNKDFSKGHKYREDAIKVLSGAKNNSEIPIELRLNVDNNDYFLTESARAIAQSKLLMDVINNDLDGVINKDDKKLVIDALVDLTNGNYLGVGETNSLQKIKIPELSSIDNAFSEVLSFAVKNGLNITEDQRKSLISEVVNKVNDMNLSDYLVHGDLDWTDIDNNEKIKNENNAKEILGSRTDYSRYSMYTVQLARLMRDAYKESNIIPNSDEIMNKALVNFVEKYDKNTVNASTQAFKRVEEPANALRKNSYAARDLKLALEMAIKQAEYKANRPIDNKKAIVENAYKAATEPAVAKAAMIMAFLKGLPGIPTTYSGDELGMTGYEEKAKNVYLQNRNVLPWSEVSENTVLGNYRKTVMEAINGAIYDRSNPDLAPLNNGTPYNLEVMANSLTHSELKLKIDSINKELNNLYKIEIKDKSTMDKINQLEEERRLLSKDFAKIAYLMQSANGDMTVTLMNAGDIEFSNRFDYFSKYGLDTEEKRKKFFEENNIESINEYNKYVPIQQKSELDAIMLAAGIAIPVGTVFTNANAKDNVEYVVKEIGGKLGIVRKDGGKIVMDGVTAKNGVMILKKISKVIFKGASNKRVYFNNQYNIVSNPYKTAEQPIEGKKLSLVAR